MLKTLENLFEMEVYWFANNLISKKISSGSNISCSLCKSFSTIARGSTDWEKHLAPGTRGLIES